MANEEIKIADCSECGKTMKDRENFILIIAYKDRTEAKKRNKFLGEDAHLCDTDCLTKWVARGASREWKG